MELFCILFSFVVIGLAMVFVVPLIGLELLGGALLILGGIIAAIFLITFLADKWAKFSEKHPKAKKKIQGCILLVILIFFAIGVIYSIASVVYAIIDDWDLLVIDFEAIVEDFKELFHK